jgi:hypothetical protein
MRPIFAGLVVAAIIVSACASASPSPSAPSTGSPAASPTQVAASSPTVTPGATGSPTTTPIPTTTPMPITTGHWLAAGATAIGRVSPDAVLLGDGSVLVAGSESPFCVRADSVETEIWRPASGDWSAGPSLNKPRAEAVLASVGGGGALVTGGVNAGTPDGDGNQLRHQAYSSSFTYDPRDAAAGWSRAALLATARADATGATLQDGRVLVAGGYYLDGTEHSQGAVSAVLAAVRSGPGGGTASDIRLTDVDIPQIVPALATAEVYDPVSDTWSATGPMRYARVGAAAVTLADGRVLVVGSRAAADASAWNDTEIQVDDRARVTFEVYDPVAGTFSLGDLPPMDWSPIADLGPSVDEGLTSAGTLVALADGGALLVGQGIEWYANSGDDYVQAVRTLRFDASSGTWSSIDQRVFVYGPDRPKVERVTGHSRELAAAARLADGHILVAGGTDFATGRSVGAADLYDPVTDSWTTLPAMPGARVSGNAVTLADGSVLVIGGRVTPDDTPVPCDQPSPGLRSTVRFIPEP